MNIIPKKPIIIKKEFWDSLAWRVYSCYYIRKYSFEKREFMADLEVYRTGSAELIEKKSRFLGKLFPVKNEDEVHAILATIKKEHYNASHHCFAYIIEDQMMIKRSSDDGEPSGTAGRPILDVMERMRICDGLLVVTRYFGGTLLGTGGLVHAYQNCAQLAARQAVLIEKKIGYHCILEIDYGMHGKLQYELGEKNIPILKTEFLEKVIMYILVPQEGRENFLETVQKITGGQEVMIWGDKVYYGSLDGQIIIL